MDFNKIIRSYFSFSKKDRVGILVLVFLILIIYNLPKFYSTQPLVSPTVLDSAAKDLLVADSTKIHGDNGKNVYPEKYGLSNKTETGFKRSKRFDFDPNELSTEGWLSLGLPERVARTITHYKEKGGKFYKPEDLKKIWGLPQGFYEYVADYIKMKTPEKFTRNPSPYSHSFSPRKIEPFDINEADTADFIALPEIGSVLARRIVNFREKLGGFYNVEQISETYGLSDSVFRQLKPYFKCKSGVVKKLNLNTAGVEELKSHPYIKWNIANAIVRYRQQHGNFHTLDELRNIQLITDDIYQKIQPYLMIP